MSSTNSKVSSMSSKIDQVEKKVLSTNSKMSSMSSKINEVDKKVSSTNSKVSSMSSKINEVEKKVSSTKSKVSTIETDVEEVKESAGWKFVGMGWTVTYDEYYYTDTTTASGHTLATCLGRCTNKRSSDSTWNGVLFHPSDGLCYCVKNDVGHNPSSYKDWIHFKFE